MSLLKYVSGVHIELDGSVPVESVASLIQGTKLELTCIFDAPDAVFLWTKVDDESFSYPNHSEGPEGSRWKIHMYCHQTWRTGRSEIIRTQYSM